MGEYDFSVTYPDSLGHVDRKVQNAVSHWKYNPRSYEYDVALLRFDEPVKFKPNVIPICLSDDNEDLAGQTGWITGWGTLYEHCNPLQGKYRFFTGNSLCSISTLTCFGSVQGLKGANFIEIQGNICILYRNIALDSYIHVYVLITGISLLFEKQQHRILEKQGKPCK